MLQVVGLQVGIGIKLLGIEVRTGAELQCLLSKVTLHGVVHSVMPMVVDDVVEGGTGEVTEEGGLGVGTRLHQIEQIEQGMMTVCREAGGDATDVHEIVGL